MHQNGSESQSLGSLFQSEPSPEWGRKDFHDLQADSVCQEHSNSLKNSESQNGDLHLHLDEHVPVVIGLMAQAYTQYTVPLDEGMHPSEGPRTYSLDASSPTEVSAVPLQVGGSSFAEDENQVEQDLVVAPEIFVDQAVNGLMIGTTGVKWQSPRASHNDAPPRPALSPLCVGLSNADQSNPKELHWAHRHRCPRG